MDGWTGLYNLRARKKLEELQDRPLFENLPPMKFENPFAQPEVKEEELIPEAGRFALDIAGARANQAPTVQLPAGEADPYSFQETTTEEKNPYAFWKTSIIGGKEGREGLPLDRAVALAGMLASSFAPQEWGGRMGAQIAQYAREGGRAHEAWEARKKLFGIEKEKLGFEGRRVAAEERQATAAERQAARPTELEMLTTEGPEKEAYLSARERLAKAQQPWTKERILTEFGPEKFREYVDNLKILEETTNPLQREVAEAQLKAANLQIQKYQWDLINDPLNAKVNRKLVDAQAERQLAEKRKIDADIKIAEDPNLIQLTKEERDSLNEADSAYNKMVSALERQYASAGGGRYVTDYKKEYGKLSQLADLTNRHAVKTNATSTRYRGSAANIEYFTNQVNRYLEELYRPIAEKKIGWLGGGKAQKEDAEQRAIALMKQVIELHKKFPGTPGSYALAKQYQDALALLEGQKVK